MDADLFLLLPRAAVVCVLTSPHNDVGLNIDEFFALQAYTNDVPLHFQNLSNLCESRIR